MTSKQHWSASFGRGFTIMTLLLTSEVLECDPYPMHEGTEAGAEQRQLRWSRVCLDSLERLSGALGVVHGVLVSWCRLRHLVACSGGGEGALQRESVNRD